MTSPAPTARLTRTHRVLIGVVTAGAVGIAGTGFAGSYTAVADLAQRQGFGWFAGVFPLGVDVGIVVLLALDLLLTWLRMPYPLLRQTAWGLTIATIAFNAAAAWPDPLGVGMHATIPVLFITTVEAARHAIGRLADITADRHIDGVPLWRWLLAPLPTFILWRRMRMWQIRSYPEAVARERDRVMQAKRLRYRYGWKWRSRAPEDAVLALRLARYGEPLSAPDTAVFIDRADTALAPFPAVSAPSADTSRPVLSGPVKRRRTTLPAAVSALPGQGADITADARADKGRTSSLTSADSVRPVTVRTGADTPRTPPGQAAPDTAADSDEPSVSALVRAALDSGIEDPAEILSAVRERRPDTKADTVRRLVRRQRNAYL